MAEQQSQIEKTSGVELTANGLMPKTIDEAWRYANALAKTAFVPQAFRGKPEDCLIAIDMAMRLRVAPLMFLQNSYAVNGRPGVEAKLVIALVNNSGLFTDPMEYEIVGDDPNKKDYRCRAFSTRARTGKILYGPWITWDIVDKEGWSKKPGSKWLTMPGMMFAYRAASWFCNMHCPEVKMGMATTDELVDMELEGTKHVDSTILEPTQGRQSFGFKQGEQPPAGASQDQEELVCKDRLAKANGTTIEPPPQEGATDAKQGGPVAAAIPADARCKCTGGHEFAGKDAATREDGSVCCPECGQFIADIMPPSEPQTPAIPAFVCDKCGLAHSVKPAKAKCLGRDGKKCDGTVVLNSGIWTCGAGHTFGYGEILATPLSTKGKCPTCDKQGRNRLDIRPVEQTPQS